MCAPCYSPTTSMKKLLTTFVVLGSLCLPVLSAAAQQDMVGQAVTVTLANGSKISGTVTKHAAGKVTLKADLIGEVVIEEKDIAGVGPAAVSAPVSTTPSQAMTPTAQWTTTGTAGYSFVSGAAPLLNVGNTHGVNLTMTTERTSATDSVSLSGTYNYQRTLPSPAGQNALSFVLGYNHQFNDRLALITRTTYGTDKVQRVDHRFVNLDGLGIVVAQTPKVTFSVAPGVGFTTTKYEQTDPILAALFANVKTDAVGYGVFDFLKVDFMPTLTFTQSFLHLRSFSTSSQHVSEAHLSLVGMVSQNVGLSLAYTFNYDSQLPEPYLKKATNSFTSGIQFKF